MTWGLPFTIKRPHGWIAEKNLVMLPYCKLSKMLLTYWSTTNMIRSQRSIGQTIAKWKKLSCCCIVHLHIYRGLIGHMILNGDQATYVLKLQGLSKRKPKTIIDDSLVFHHSFLIFKNGFGNCLGGIQQLNGGYHSTNQTPFLCSLCIYRLSC